MLSKKLLISMAAALLVATPSGAAIQERVWTRSQILAITDAEARRQGADPEKMSVSFDAYNSHWTSYKESTARAEKKAMRNDPASLKGHKYIAVYYASLKPVRDGDFYVFIDHETGEVLQSMRWR